MTGRIHRTTAPVKKRGPLPEIGKIKVGEVRKSQGGKEYPASLDYFRATGKYAGLFSRAFGAEPRSLTVTFVSDDPAISCEERYELRDKGGRLFADGDGRTFRVWNPRSERYVEVSASDQPDIMDRAAGATPGGPGWAVVLTLRFILPEIRGVMGHWSLTTKGEASSIPAIREAFDFVLDTAGTVSGVPFDLQVEKVQSQKPGSKSVFPVVSLVPNVSAAHLDTVRRFIESGQHARGLLTEARIETLEPRLLEAGPNNPDA